MYTYYGGKVMAKAKMPTQHEVNRRLARENVVDALRDGRKTRAVRFPNVKAVAAKRACRDKARWA